MNQFDHSIAIAAVEASWMPDVVVEGLSDALGFVSFCRVSRRTVALFWPKVAQCARLFLYSKGSF